MRMKDGGKPRWQSLADEVWQQLVDGEADEVTRGRSIAAALQPFKEWLARGAKRQRVTPRAARDAAPAAAPASGQCSVPSSKSGHPPVPSAAPRSQSKGAVHAANARVPLHQLSQNAVNARDAGVRKDGFVPGPVSQEGGASCGPGGRVAIHAEALQKQRTNLRKASRPPGKHVGKENMGPKNTATAGFAADNLVLKRLKENGERGVDRRAMLDDKADDETDTAWGHTQSKASTYFPPPPSLLRRHPTMPPVKTREDEDEETALVIKIASILGAVLAAGTAVLAIFGVSLSCRTVRLGFSDGVEPRSGTESSQLLIAGLDGTETTLRASVSLWEFDLELQLAPKEGSINGEARSSRCERLLVGRGGRAADLLGARSLGNVLEWYEFAVFSFLEPHFQSHFFQGSAVSAWLGFACTFLARPFGGLALGVIGDLFGRKASTFLSIFGMMVGTVGQGLLPTYQNGPVWGSLGLTLLVFLRLLQGICTGGEIAAVSTYITEVGPKDSLARSMQLGLSPFRRQRAPTGKKMKDLVTRYWATLLLGMGGVASVAVLQYGCFVWCSVLLQKKGTDATILLASGVAARVGSIVLAPIMAWLADLQGIGWNLFWGSFVMFLLGLPCFLAMLTHFDNFAVVLASYGLGYGFLLSALGMTYFLYVVELFPVHVRNAGVGLSYNIGMCCFGGFAPMIFEASFEHYTWAPGWLISLAGLITSSTVAYHSPPAVGGRPSGVSPAAARWFRPQIYNLRTTWDDACAQAERTSATVPYCTEVTIARACIILEAIFSSFMAAMVILARRFSPLLLLAAVGCGVIGVLFAFGVMTSTTGLGGYGFLLLGGSLVTGGLGVAAVFYAAAKAMPPPPDGLEEVRKTRMSNLQETPDREKDLAAMLEENVQRRRRESEAESGTGQPAGPRTVRRVPVMLQKVIFWTQENEENEEAELPMELLQAAYQEIDEDGSGSVTLVELVDALKLCGLNASEAAATTVMQEIDKNMNGTIDIHEFVIRGTFSEATGGDTYPILRNCLMVFSIVLVVLFLLVIGIPAARMTLGVQVAAWQHHYNTSLQPSAKFKNKQRSVESRGVRSAAWAEGAGTAQPQVNAAKYGASYRVSKMTYDAAGEQAALQQQAEAVPAARPSVGAPGHLSHRSHRSEHSQVPSGAGSAVPTTRPQGAILSKTGEFVRYDPAAYRNAAMNSMGARMPMSFTPMQVQNMGTSADEPGQVPGVMSRGVRAEFSGLPQARDPFPGLAMSNLTVRLSSPAGRSRIVLPSTATLADLQAEVKARCGVEPNQQQLSLDRAGAQLITGEASKLLTQLGIANGTEVHLSNREASIAGQVLTKEPVAKASAPSGPASSSSAAASSSPPKAVADGKKADPKFETFDAFLRKRQYDVGALPGNQKYVTGQIKRGGMMKIPPSVSIKQQPCADTARIAWFRALWTAPWHSHPAMVDHARVLVLGDGDLSFSAALHESAPDLRMVATTFESREELPSGERD
eukprot:g19247.t1